MPRADWQKGVDPRRPLQPEEDEPSSPLDSPSLVSEKVHGKRPAVDEPVQKRRKTASSHAHKPGGISLGEDRAVRPQRMAVLEWSNDDEDQSALPPSTTEAPADFDAPKHRA